MLYPNPYFFFRTVKEGDWVAISRWMGQVGGLSSGRELAVLRQMKKQNGGATMWIAVVGGSPAFLLELVAQGNVYLTGLPVIHTNPWRALEAWGLSIPYIFSQVSIPEISISLPDSREAEIKALLRLGCRRTEKEMDCYEESWIYVCRPKGFRAG